LRDVPNICTGGWCNTIELALDPGERGNCLVLLNDYRGISAAPNAMFVNSWHWPSGSPHVMMVTTASIGSEQELLLDYGEVSQWHALGGSTMP
jgi:hypothetical protein